MLLCLFSSDGFVIISSENFKKKKKMNESAKIQEFMEEKLPKNLMQVPGITENNKQNLNQNNINTVDDLVGYFFLSNRGEEDFCHFLVVLGFSKYHAFQCAACLRTKLGGL
jgi:hypothetical protein